jgi:hypothetical protein
VQIIWGANINDIDFGISYQLLVILIDFSQAELSRGSGS